MVNPEQIQEIPEEEHQPNMYDQAKITAKVWQQVARWQRKHDEDKIKQMREKFHFEIDVKIIGSKLSFTMT